GRVTEGVVELKAKRGADMKKWHWGDLHVAEFKHQLANDDARRAAFNLKSVPRGGDANTVNATSYVGTSFVQRAVASLREILDPADWDRSVAIIVPRHSVPPHSRPYL